MGCPEELPPPSSRPPCSPFFTKTRILHPPPIATLASPLPPPPPMAALPSPLTLHPISSLVSSSPIRPSSSSSSQLHPPPPFITTPSSSSLPSTHTVDSSSPPPLPSTSSSSSIFAPSSTTCTWQSSPIASFNHSASTGLCLPSTLPGHAQILPSMACSNGCTTDGELPLLAFLSPSLATSPTASPRQPSSPSYSSSSSPSGPSSPSSSSQQSNFTFSVPEKTCDPNSGGMPARLSHADELFQDGKLLPLWPACSAQSVSMYAEMPIVEKIYVHEAQLCDPRTSVAPKSHMVAHPYKALMPLSSTSQVLPPKVFRIEEKEAYPNYKLSSSSTPHNSFNMFSHTEASSIPHEVSPISHNLICPNLSSAATSPVRNKLSTSLHSSPQTTVFVSASPPMKCLSHTSQYGHVGNKDSMHPLHRTAFVQAAPLARREQLTLVQLLHDEGPKKVHSSSFFKRLKIKLCCMVGARSRKVKMKKEQDFKIQADHKFSGYDNLRDNQGHPCSLNNTTQRMLRREHFKPIPTQRKAMRKVYNVSSPHAHHYINQRAEVERLKKKTFLPYHSHLFSCIGFSL